MRLVRDVRRRAGPGARPGGGVRPRGGRPPVPRVRVPDAHRPAAAARRRAARGRGRGDARAARGGFPGGPGPGRRAGSGAGWTGPGGRGARVHRPAADGGRSSSRWTSTWSSGGGAGGAGARRRASPADVATPSRRAPRRSRPPTGDLPGALAAAIVDPGRIELVGRGARVRRPRALAARPGRGRRRARRWTTRGRSPAPRSRSPSRARTDASSRPRARRPPIALRHLLEALGTPLVGPRGQAAAHGALRRGRRTRARTPVAFDTQIAAYLVNAALRAQKIADVVAERLDLVLPPAAAGLPPDRRRPASRPCPRSPSGRRLEQALRDEGVERLFAEIELPLIPILARMEAAGVALDQDALRALETRVRDRDRRGSRPRSTRSSATSSPSAAPSSWARSCSRSSGLPEGPQDQDRLLDRRDGPRGAARRPPGHRAGARLADLHQAPLDLRRGAAAPARARRAAAHAVPPGRRGDRAPLLVRPEPPEHPDPHAARPPDPARVRRGLAGHHAGRRRLQPDRAADPRPRVGRRAPRATRSPARPTSTARPPRACSARRPRTSPSDERSMAKMVNFGLAYGMSDFGLSSAGRGSAGRTRRSSSTRLLRGVQRDQPLHAPHPRDGGRAGLRVHAAGPQAPDPGAHARRTGRSRPPASGWRSTCRSRARPPTS